MKKKSPRIGYTVEEMDARMKKYIQKSADRLIHRLRIIWKKNNIKPKTND